MKKIIVLISLLTLVCSCNPNKFKDWAPTPPMGWNSWDCYGPTVTEDEVKANADYMAENLLEYGWEYVVVDIRWFVENDKAGGYNVDDPRYVLDEYGRYTPAVNRFPSAADGQGFKPLADYIHDKGLKFGIHIMRGIPKVAVDQKLPVKGAKGVTADQIASASNLCDWLPDNLTVDATKRGAQQYYNSLFELYASWGVDFVKVDDLSRPYHEDEIEMIRKAIDRCGRQIVFSASPGETPVECAEHIASNANMWRMVGDVWDKWEDIKHLIEVAQDWYPYIGEGNWPDCDMIPLGHIAIRGERGADRWSKLTLAEQKTLMTFFAIFRSPLMYGGDLPTIDGRTLSLLTNLSILDVHRYGTDVRQLYQKYGICVVTSNVKDKVCIAIFNLRDEPMEVGIPLNDAGLQGPCSMTELWSGKTLADVESGQAVYLAPHGSAIMLEN